MPLGKAASGLLKFRGTLRRFRRGARRSQDGFCVPVYEDSEKALYFRRHIVWKLPRIHIGSVSGALKAVEMAGSTAGRTARVRGDGGVGRRVQAGGPSGSDWPRQWSSQGGVAGRPPAQWKAPGLTAQKGEERVKMK